MKIRAHPRRLESGDDGFDDAERQELYRALDEGMAAARAGDHADAADFVQELLARK